MNKNLYIVKCRNGIGSYGEKIDSCNDITAIIPDDVEIIYYNVFSRLHNNVRKIIFGKNVKKVFTDVLVKGCENLEEIVVNPENPFFKSIDGVLYSFDETQIIKYPPMKKDSVFTIPKAVKYIERGCFNKCAYLEELYITEDVRFLNNESISFCNKLRKIDFNSIVDFGSNAITDCPDLASSNEFSRDVIFLGRGTYNCPRIYEVINE